MNKYDNRMYEKLNCSIFYEITIHNFHYFFVIFLLSFLKNEELNTQKVKFLCLLIQ